MRSSNYKQGEITNDTHLLRVSAPLFSVHSVPYKAIIDRLIQARVDARLTQDQVARMWGRTQSIVAKIENRERRIDVVEFVALSLIVQLDPAAVVDEIRSRYFDKTPSL